MEKQVTGEPLNRVDGKLKVTGAATYSAEYKLPDMVYAVLVGSTIAKGTITGIDTKAAAHAPGVLIVVTHENAVKAPGYTPGQPSGKGALKVFYDNKIYFDGQPVAMVLANTIERARYGASLVKVQYSKEAHATDFEQNKGKAAVPSQQRSKEGAAEYTSRGTLHAYKNAPVQLEAEYIHPSEMHNPMELQAITAHWEADDKLTLYDKVQGTQPTQRNFAKEWKLPLENVKVISTFVGGSFGNGLHNWPHETAAIIGAKMVKRPVKLMLTREQMFTLVGYRPHTWQKIGIGATKDGKLVGISHESIGQTSSYEEFTESTLQQTKMMYAAPNISTLYRILPLDISTPIWMRGPGEATGAFALESAMDELAHSLGIDPIEFRLINYTEKDPDRNLPWSTKFLKECYQMGADGIGWKNRKLLPGQVRKGDWLVGYGMAAGTFGAHRSGAKVRATLLASGALVLQSAVTDIGPGTGTAMTQIAADTIGIAPGRITFQLGNSQFPQAGNQGGSSTVASVGSAVVAACQALQQRLLVLAAGNHPAFTSLTVKEVVFEDGAIATKDKATQLLYTDLLKKNNMQDIDVIEEAKPGNERQQYSMYSYSVHFAEVHVHAVTGQVKVAKVVSCADAGIIVNSKTAGNQIIGGVTGGIGMALHEHAVMDHRYGRYMAKDFADYHVPVHADIPKVDVHFVNKPDYLLNPMGTKGLGEIAIIGVAPAITNAIFNATGKRIRELPVTPDKLL